MDRYKPKPLTPDQEERMRRVKDERARREAEQKAIEEKREKMTDEEVIRDLKQPIENILVGLLPEIESGAYSTFVGDDASGRIPTIILANVVRHIYQKKGFADPVIRFLAGSSGIHYEASGAESKKQQALRDQVGRMKEMVGKNNETKKALLVTDTISSGQSVEILNEAFRANDWPVDVATIGEQERAEVDWLAENIRTKIISGGKNVPALYFRKELSGIVKNVNSLFAEVNHDVDPERVHRGREYARDVANELIAAYDNGQLMGRAEIYKPLS